MSGTHLLRKLWRTSTRRSIGTTRRRLKLLVTVLFMVGVVLVPVVLRPWLWIRARRSGSWSRDSPRRQHWLPPSAFLARARPHWRSRSRARRRSSCVVPGSGARAVFAALALKSTACVAAAQLFAHTTPFYDLLAVLRRALIACRAHPHARASPSVSLRRHRRIASYAPREGGAHLANLRRSTWEVVPASVVAVSFVRSTARAERIALAMRARGWS